jgi:hypothetical protein
MAQAINRVLIKPCDARTINSTATYTSAQQDLGDDRDIVDIWMYAEVTGYATTPAGNKRLTVQIAPVHTTGGDAFADGAATYLFTVAADQAYRFAWPVASLPRFFKVLVKNDTDQNTDANAVSVWIEYTEVTV